MMFQCKVRVYSVHGFSLASIGVVLLLIDCTASVGTTAGPSKNTWLTFGAYLLSLLVIILGDL